jgi:predicted metal-dependent phosphoesterase TrpH/energy-coupling factor transporter ATP-binding protein EcfA2
MSKSLGSHFRAADLHVHSPASLDFIDRGATPRNIVEAGIAKGLELIAVTDHNSGDWVDRVRSAAAGTTLTVIAGVEVTCPEGHIIGLFDSKHTGASIQDFLVRIGIPREKHGKEDAISESHAEDVIREIDKMGGVAIAAHANTKAIGLLQQKGQYKLKVFAMAELRALEFTQREDVEKFCSGKVSADYAPKACLQGSDAHSLKDIGSRLTYLKMHDASISGIRQALGDHEVRVRFPWNHSDAAHPRIISLTVSQGFFGGQIFRFHNNLNCLVGGQGAGKSTVIEMLRYCFEDRSGFDHIIEDHESKIESLVGVGGIIEVEYFDSDGETKMVRREFHDWETLREVRDEAGNDAEIETPPAFFSQGELVDIARSPLAQLELLDRRLNTAQQDRDERDLINKLGTLTTSLVADTEKIVSIEADIVHAETGLAATKSRHAQLKAKLAEPVLTAFPNWEAEQAYIRDMSKAIGALPEALEACLDDFDLDATAIDLPEDAPNAKSLKPLGKISGEIERLLAKVKADFNGGVKGQLKIIVEASDRVRPAFDAERKKYDGILAGIGQVNVNKATSQLRALTTRLETLGKQSAECERLRARIEKTSRDRNGVIAQLRLARQARAAMRKAKAAEYQAALSTIVELDVLPLADRSALNGALRDLSKGAMVKDPDLARIAQAFEPSELAALILAGNVTAVAAASGVTKEVAARFVERCTEKGAAAIFALDALPLGDTPVFKYVIAPGRSRPLFELSTGQKGTVIIALALVEGLGPLVVDHPEEPLDTKSIYGQVVGQLRRGKDSRQFIFTTHNANIAIGADAELSHVLGATADKGTIEGCGGIDHEETNQLLLLHLEGGAEALNRRVRKYMRETGASPN